MAWRSHGSSNSELVNNLKRNGIISDARVVNAMLAVDRANFCKTDPYQDCPQSIGFSVSISAPHMHGHALQHLRHQLKEGAKALDVGSGSGYLTACMAVMVGNEGRVIGVEHIPELVDLSVRNIAKGNADLLKTKRVKILGEFFFQEVSFLRAYD
jgi:protein-L-isoaspartate(D-aspartate) O-methyltransferase